MPDDTAAAPLVGRSFRVAAIEGVPVLDTPVAEITFGADGHVTGRGTVNRFAGRYSLDGDVLTLGPLAGTLMAGSPEAMDQEQRLHRALARSLTVVPEADARRVELRSGDDAVLLLAASDPDERM
jgi:heat shock protein HslJ